MESIVFDTSSIISLAMNNLLWVLRPLKRKFKGDFYISNSVKNELVDKPLKSKKFKFEALTIMKLLNENELSLYKNSLDEKTNLLLSLANKTFMANNNWINIVHKGEIEALALASHLKSDAYIVDERTTRLLLENPKRLMALLEKKLHTKVTFNGKNFRQFQKEIGKINVLRSSELLIIAYELGLFNDYILNEDMKKTLLDGLLWGTKLRGCSISVNEIDDFMRLEGFK